MCNGSIFACFVHVWLYFVEKLSLGSEIGPRSRQRPLPKPLQVTATRSPRRLCPDSHAFCSKEQKTAPVHRGLSYCSSRPFSQDVPL